MNRTDTTRVVCDISAPTATKFVVLIGIVSLFSDLTYQGARSVTGPFLAVLGASGTAVGTVAGLGELVAPLRGLLPETGARRRARVLLL